MLTPAASPPICCVVCILTHDALPCVFYFCVVCFLFFHTTHTHIALSLCVFSLCVGELFPSVRGVFENVFCFLSPAHMAFFPHKVIANFLFFVHTPPAAQSHL